MAKTFDNLGALLKDIGENILTSNLEIIGEEIKQKLRDNVDKLWYSTFTPYQYERTFEYINSISVSKAKRIENGYEVVIFFDTDKINPYPPPAPGKWSKHQSITNAQDVSEMIPIWIEEGQNSPIYSYAGAEPVGVTKEQLEEEKFLQKRMMELLIAQGYKCL